MYVEKTMSCYFKELCSKQHDLQEVPVKDEDS